MSTQSLVRILFAGLAVMQILIQWLHPVPPLAHPASLAAQPEFGEFLVLEVGADDTIADVKAQIQDETGVIIMRQDLIYPLGGMPPNEQRVSDCRRLLGDPPMLKLLRAPWMSMKTKDQDAAP